MTGYYTLFVLYKIVKLPDNPRFRLFYPKGGHQTILEGAILIAPDGTETNVIGRFNSSPDTPLRKSAAALNELCSTHNLKVVSHCILEAEDITAGNPSLVQQEHYILEKRD